MISAHLEAAAQRQTTRTDPLKAEILPLEREASRLVRFLAQGDEYHRVSGVRLAVLLRHAVGHPGALTGRGV